MPSMLASPAAVVVLLAVTVCPAQPGCLRQADYHQGSSRQAPPRADAPFPAAA